MRRLFSHLLKARSCDKPFNIDLHRLVRELTKDQQLIRPFYYTSFNPDNAAQVAFLERLELTDFHVIRTPLRRRGEVLVEKGVDVALVTDLLAYAFRKAYDLAIIVSGDSDFLNAIKEVMRLGIQLHIACFKANASREMKSAGDLFIPLDSLAEQVEKK
ncbi:MAG: NYN domain-containing protein [Candidatus Heimdallarchaeota archaeon]